MRMFLVVMCDVFLLLYLTSISMHDRYPVSSVTLQDYQVLRARQASVKRRETRTAARFQEAQERARRMEARSGDLQRELAEMSARTQEAEARQAEAHARLDQANEDLGRARTSADEARVAAQQRVEEARAQAVRKQEELQKVSSEKEAALSQAKGIESRLEAAAAEAERAKAAEAEALEARREAERMMVEARSKELKAAREASEASLRAAQSDRDAQWASERAEAAVKEKEQQQARLRAVLQPAQRAYEQNVESQLVPVRAEWRRDGFLGAREEEFELRGLPVRSGAHSVVFEPRAQLGFEPDLDPDEVQNLRLSVSGRPVSALLVSSREPDLVGLSLAAPLPPGRTVVDSTNYMPTLLAVRNGSRPVFSDRIRGLDTKHFLLDRDRLRRDGRGRLAFSLEGFRGTGDFGELIMEGDQVVDLEGNLVGIAIARNLVAPIRIERDWHEIPLAGRSSTQVLNEAAKFWGDS